MIWLPKNDFLPPNFLRSFCNFYKTILVEIFVETSGKILRNFFKWKEFTLLRDLATKRLIHFAVKWFFLLICFLFPHDVNDWKFSDFRWDFSGSTLKINQFFRSTTFRIHQKRYSVLFSRTISIFRLPFSNTYLNMLSIFQTFRNS